MHHVKGVGFFRTWEGGGRSKGGRKEKGKKKRGERRNGVGLYSSREDGLPELGIWFLSSLCVLVDVDF